MDKIAKALLKLSQAERRKLKEILAKIEKSDFSGLDLKKLQARDDIYRVRKGDMRIIFHKTSKAVKILALERRTTTTYRKK
ncbi:MAG: type II toxin-antitoxin system RelE/ParE family toxin [Candidatus Pacebacteria bacterium]|nr:type II toxin-antitoxin system RelE/ParE family toxin [Candidatus Paceibacterota bacterium]